MVSHVWHDQYLRGFPPSAPPLSQSFRPAERRGRRINDAGTKILRGQGQGCVALFHLSLTVQYWHCTEYVSKYASKEAVDEAGEDTESEDELSSAGSYESGGEEPAGAMDDVWSIYLAYRLCSRPTRTYCIPLDSWLYSIIGTGPAGVYFTSYCGVCISLSFSLCHSSSALEHLLRLVMESGKWHKLLRSFF